MADKLPVRNQLAGTARSSIDKQQLWRKAVMYLKKEKPPWRSLQKSHTIYFSGRWAGKVSKHGCYAILAQKVLFQIQIFHQAGLENGMGFISMACFFQLCLIFLVKVAAGSVFERREEHVRTRVFPVRFHWLALGSAGSKHKHFP